MDQAKEEATDVKVYREGDGIAPFRFTKPLLAPLESEAQTNSLLLRAKVASKADA